MSYFFSISWLLGAPSNEQILFGPTIFDPGPFDSALFDSALFDPTLFS